MPDVSLGVRIAKARGDRGLSQAKLARALKRSQAAIGQWETGEREPDIATISAIAAELRVSPGWLAFDGAGVESLPLDMVAVRELDARAAAGPNAMDLDVMKGREAEATLAVFGFPSAGFRDIYGASPERVRMLPVIGDSMAPTLMPGQKIMVDTEDKRPTPPGIFVVWDGLGLVIKRVTFVVAHSEPARVRISSDNPRYDPYERLVEEAYIQGRVISVIGRV